MDFLSPPWIVPSYTQAEATVVPGIGARRVQLVFAATQASHLPDSDQLVVCGCISDRQVKIPAVFTEESLQHLQSDSQIDVELEGARGWLLLLKRFWLRPTLAFDNVCCVIDVFEVCSSDEHLVIGSPIDSRRHRALLQSLRHKATVRPSADTCGSAGARDGSPPPNTTMSIEESQSPDEPTSLVVLLQTLFDFQEASQQQQQQQEEKEGEQCSRARVEGEGSMGRQELQRTEKGRDARQTEANDEAPVSSQQRQQLHAHKQHYQQQQQHECQGQLCLEEGRGMAEVGGAGDKTRQGRFTASRAEHEAEQVHHDHHGFGLGPQDEGPAGNGNGNGNAADIDDQLLSHIVHQHTQDGRLTSSSDKGHATTNNESDNTSTSSSSKHRSLGSSDNTSTSSSSKHRSLGSSTNNSTRTGDGTATDDHRTTFTGGEESVEPRSGACVATPCSQPSQKESGSQLVDMGVSSQRSLFAALSPPPSKRARRSTGDSMRPAAVQRQAQRHSPASAANGGLGGLAVDAANPCGSDQESTQGDSSSYQAWNANGARSQEHEHERVQVQGQKQQDSQQGFAIGNARTKACESHNPSSSSSSSSPSSSSAAAAERNVVANKAVLREFVARDYNVHTSSIMCTLLTRSYLLVFKPQRRPASHMVVA